MKKSELKEMIKMALSEDARTDAEQEGYKDGFEDAKDDIEAKLKDMKVSEGDYYYEDSMEDMSLDDQAKIYFMQKVKRGEIDELPEDPKAAFLAQMMKDQSLEEQEEEVEITDTEEEVEISDTEEEAPSLISSNDEKILNSLEAALSSAQELGDEKLINQIGNTITFFTRQHIVKEEDLFEMKRMKRLAGILK
jgi:hypothetical protein